MADGMRQTVAGMLKGIESAAVRFLHGVDRYNPDNLMTLERYVEVQSRENEYDLEANLAVLKLYQLNPHMFKKDVVCQILLKALTNLPHTDFILCRCLLTEAQCNEAPVSEIVLLADLLERCDFVSFWLRLSTFKDLQSGINGFSDSIRKFVCHVVGITFQTIHSKLLSELLGGVDSQILNHWIRKYGWTEKNEIVFVTNQDENIKTKNITEKIDFESVASLMAACL